MRRDQLEHIIRAAGDVLGETTVIVIGSQAILASVPDPPPTAARSIEADILPLDDPDERKADRVDSAIGEASMFQERFGVYAQGVSMETARLPDGWRPRLIPLRTENTEGVTGLCLEPHDLAVSKLIAGRSKDLDFCRDLLSYRIIDRAIVEERLDLVSDLTANEREMLRQVVVRLEREGGSEA